jgi:predicted ribonuclease YlaK
MSRRRNRNVDLIDETSTFFQHNSVSLVHTKQYSETLTLHDIKPKNYSQETAFDSFLQGNHLILAGSAGTGKSYISLYLAVRKALEEENKSVLIIRSAVQTREIGHTPGTLEEKEDLYAQPYKDIINKLFHRAGAWNELKKQKKVDFQTTSFIRGLTFDDTILIVDEAQNLTFSELNSVMTRVGKGSQVIICGDIRQTDLNGKKEKTCWQDMLSAFNKMSNIDIINFLPADIVRSGFTKEWVIACEDLGLPRA